MFGFLKKKDKGEKVDAAEMERLERERRIKERQDQLKDFAKQSKEQQDA